MKGPHSKRPLNTMIVLGTRPEVTKLAPVALELRRHPKRFRVTLVGTGQHRDLVPQHIPRMDALLGEQRPDVVVVEGDTTAVLMAALAAFYRQIPVAHVEAGLRSGDPYDPFPEEMNRRLVSPLAAVHFAPTATARDNLLVENIAAERIFVTGNTAIDALLLAARRRPRRSAVPARLLKGRRLLLVTAHRRENWGEGVRGICLALRELAKRFSDVLIVYAVHPNPVVRDTAREILAGEERVLLTDPLDYVELIDLMKRSHLILTDSGGIQEEAPSLGKPILVMRKTTERTEGIAAGCSELVGADPKRIVGRASALLTDSKSYEAMVSVSNPYGDGRAASRIRQALAYHFGLSRRRPREFSPQ
jgi:UDP-N-acetylglucosamine 2-epimerase (non-hydrolysing)